MDQQSAVPGGKARKSGPAAALVLLRAARRNPERFGLRAYPYGLSAFGKKGTEALNAPARPEKLRDPRFGMAGCVLEQNATLRNGETIGASAGQRRPMTRGPGVSLDGVTLELGYPGG